MRIDGQEAGVFSTLQQSMKTGTKSAGKDFAELLAEKIQQANRAGEVADQKAAELLVGNGSIHETMIALEEADISLRLVGTIRDKVIGAYQELSRMQI
jgi:flagellar hook-basal body complex protein FliE